jgi:tetrahydromethanopterin S-methyltransferase subunit C
MKRLLKILGMAAAAGAGKTLLDTLPTMVAPKVRDLVAVVVAAVVGYVLPQPKK